MTSNPYIAFKITTSEMSEAFHTREGGTIIDAKFFQASSLNLVSHRLTSYPKASYN